MKSLISVVIATLTCALLLAGCGDQLTAIEVGERFWAAIEARDADQVRKYVMAGSMTEDELSEDILEISQVELGRTVIDGDTAVIDTTVTVLSDKPIAVPVATNLVMENGAWKVDYQSTIASVSTHSELAELLAKMRGVGEQLAGELNKSLDELQDAIPVIEEEVRKFEEAVKSQIPELRKRIEEFAKELEEALRRPPEDPQPVGQPIRI